MPPAHQGTANAARLSRPSLPAPPVINSPAMAAASATTPASGKSVPRSRCVLWHAPGTALPADLVLSLERRGVEMVSCTSAYTAMARASLLERENDERTDDPAERDSLVLVLVTPKSL